MDTVIAVRDGVRRYLFAWLNLRSRFGLTVATPGMSSRWARDFADFAFDLFPGPVDRVLSDNGSEYEGEFADLLTAHGIARYYTHPKTPKMNAHAERFNRTAQKEFLDYHEDLLWGDEANLAALNRKLAEWLLRYNGERPHEALGQRTPIAALARERPMLDHLPRPPPPGVAEPATPPSTPPDRSGSVFNKKNPKSIGPVHMGDPAHIICPQMLSDAVRRRLNADAVCFVAASRHRAP